MTNEYPTHKGDTFQLLGGNFGGSCNIEYLRGVKYPERRAALISRGQRALIIGTQIIDPAEIGNAGTEIANYVNDVIFPRMLRLVMEYDEPWRAPWLPTNLVAWRRNDAASPWELVRRDDAPLADRERQKNSEDWFRLAWQIEQRLERPIRHVEVPNKYDGNPANPWHEVTVRERRGTTTTLVIGDRKRVTHIGFGPELNVEALGLLAARDGATFDEACVHAWNEEHLLEYIAALFEGR